MRKFFVILILSIVLVSFFIAGWFARQYSRDKNSLLSQVTEKLKDRTLEKYMIENLQNSEIKKGEFVIKEVISQDTPVQTEELYTSHLFEYKFYPGVDNEQKIVTGQINIPTTTDKKDSVVLMIRGYVDQKIYTTGVGTKNAAKVFAENGFVTVAPDFLGYAGSSSESANIFETRFQTYTTVLSLLKNLEDEYKNIFIWAHSNGGQVALTSLAVTKGEYPTTLWAPVTKPFPYSVLYYTDESIDGGKFIRSELSRFEESYDVDKFSFTSYLENIVAPIQIQQGGQDDAIPLEWSENFAEKIKAKIFIYPSADHNLRPDWDIAVARDLEFFRESVQN